MKTQPTVLAVVPSSSTPNKSYEIRMGHDHKVYCTCPSWKFNKSPIKTCRHLEEFRKAH